MKTGSILFIRNAFGLGGAELYSYFIAKELKRLGYKVILSSNLPSLREKVSSLGYPTYQPIWTGPLKGITFRILTLLTLPILSIFYLYIILRRGVVIVNVMSPHDLIALGFIQKILGFRMVWTDHGDLKNFSKIKTSLMRSLVRYGLSKCQTIIVVSHDERARIVESLPWPEIWDKMKVVYNGVEVPEKPHKISSDLIVIGSTARVQVEKGIDTFIEALPVVKKNVGPVFKVVLAGAIDHQEIPRRVEELGLTGDVSFVGFQEDVPSFLRQLDIYVFPSRSEVFPFSTLEAMAAGLPIVATRVGGIPEQITNGKEGYLVDLDDVKTLSECLSKLIKDPALRKNMGGRAYLKAKSEFNIKDMTNKLLSIYGI